MLTERQQLILGLLVKLYGQSEEPIGSKTLLHENSLKVSPATIRNDMVALERAGLLVKAHKSSGRIPSPAGLKYYVSRLIHHETLQFTDDDEEIQRTIDEMFIQQGTDLRQRSQLACDLLASMTGLTGILFVQSEQVHRFDEVKLVSLDDYHLIVILVTDTGLFQNYLVDLAFPMTREQASSVTELLKEELTGLSLEEAYQRLKLSVPFMIQRLIGYQLDISEAVSQLNLKIRSNQYHVSGKHNLFDFVNPQSGANTYKYLFKLIDGSSQMYQLLEDLDEGIQVQFGTDLGSDQGLNVSLVTGSFSTDELRITLGVLGPTTMNYQQVITMINHMIHKLKTF